MKLIDKLKEVRGNHVVAQLKLFGIQLFRICKTSPIHINVYILYVPLFRIVLSKQRFEIHLLVVVWLYKFLVALGNNLRITANGDTAILQYAKKNIIEFSHNGKEKALKIVGKNIVGSYYLEPYEFPSAKFVG